MRTTVTIKDRYAARLLALTGRNNLAAAAREAIERFVRHEDMAEYFRLNPVSDEVFVNSVREWEASFEDADDGETQ